MSRGKDGHNKTGSERKDVNDAKTQGVLNLKDGNGHGKTVNAIGKDTNDATNLRNSKDRYNYGETQHDSKDTSDAKTHNVHLPPIGLHKAGKTKDKRGDNQRQPVYDPRFRSLLSSLIALPRQFGQIQCYAPSTRLSFKRMQKQK